MSYILDALKKAEQARSRGRAPDLFATQAEELPAAARKPLWPWLLGALLAINAAVAFYWLQAPPVDGPPRTAPFPAEAAAPAAVVTGAPMAANPPANPKIAPPPVLTARIDTPLKPGEHRAEQPRPPLKKEAEKKAAEKIEPGKKEAEKKSPEKKEPGKKDADTKVPARQETSEPRDLAAASATGEGRVPAPSVPNEAVPKTETGTDQRLLRFAELPPGVQQELPKMAVSMHMYSGNPSHRLVSVNDKSLREGDELAPGLKLMEITPDGLVWSYQGYRFRKGITQP